MHSKNKTTSTLLVCVFMQIINGWILTCVVVSLPRISLRVLCPGQRQDQQQQDAQQVFAGDEKHNADENCWWHSKKNLPHMLWWIRDCAMLWTKNVFESRYSSTVNLHFLSFMSLSAVRRGLGLQHRGDDGRPTTGTPTWRNCRRRFLMRDSCLDDTQQIRKWLLTNIVYIGTRLVAQHKPWHRIFNN